MRSDTADLHWNQEWADLDADSKWRVPEEDVQRWAETLQPGCKILDLGAGIGRHAVALAKAGFSVSALDAASEGVAAIDVANVGVNALVGRMDELPFEIEEFDHVLSWNVIYHGNETVLLNSISEIRRVLKPGGTFLGTMLSKRRLPREHERYGTGTEVSRNTWVWDVDHGDKRHPHYFCSAAELLALFQGFEVKWLEDREHEKPGTWHWHMIAERLK